MAFPGPTAVFQVERSNDLGRLQMADIGVVYLEDVLDQPVGEELRDFHGLQGFPGGQASLEIRHLAEESPVECLVVGQSGVGGPAHDLFFFGKMLGGVIREKGHQIADDLSAPAIPHRGMEFPGDPEQLFVLGVDADVAGGEFWSPGQEVGRVPGRSFCLKRCRLMVPCPLPHAVLTAIIHLSRKKPLANGIRTASGG